MWYLFKNLHKHFSTETTAVTVSIGTALWIGQYMALWIQNLSNSLVQLGRILLKRLKSSPFVVHSCMIALTLPGRLLTLRGKTNINVCFFKQAWSAMSTWWHKMIKCKTSCTTVSLACKWVYWRVCCSIVPPCMSFESLNEIIAASKRKAVGRHEFLAFFIFPVIEQQNNKYIHIKVHENIPCSKELYREVITPMTDHSLCCYAMSPLYIVFSMIIQ